MPRRRSGEKACRYCRTEGPREETFDDTIEFRGLLVDVTGLKRFRCGSCGRTWESVDHSAHNRDVLRSAYSQKREAVREELGLLTAPEIHTTRELLGLTQKEASLLFGGCP